MEAKIDLNRIAVFVRVVEAGGFTAAARQLGLPTSTASRSVARLEQELGIRLLHRTTRKLGLTDAGRGYFQRMQAVVAEVQAASRAVSGLTQEVRGTVRVTVPEAGSLLPLGPIFAALVAAHSGLVLDVVVTGRHVDLVEEGIDLAVRGGALRDSSLMSRRIAPSTFGVVAAPSYLARRGAPRGLADLARHDCILLRARGGDLVPWRLGGAGRRGPVTARAALICDDLGLVYQATLAGVGLGLLPLHAVAGDLGAGRLVHLLPRHLVTGGALHVVWPSQRLLPARVARVRDGLVAGLTEHM